MTDEELIARLRACANGNGSFKSNQGDYGVCDDAADRIEALSLGVKYERALRIASDAASAAAYEAAAEWCADEALNCDDAAKWGGGPKYVADCKAAAYALRNACNHIRALATPEQTAALDRVRAEAKAEGMRAAYDSLFKHPGFLHQISGQTFKAVKLEDAAEGILAAIPKGGV